MSKVIIVYLVKKKTKENSGQNKGITLLYNGIT